VNALLFALAITHVTIVARDDRCADRLQPVGRLKAGPHTTIAISPAAVHTTIAVVTDCC